MMTYQTLKLFCLQNRHDITRVDQVEAPHHHVVVVTFNDQSSLRLHLEDGRTARSVSEQLRLYVHP
jgi:hypothetical protein